MAIIPKLIFYAFHRTYMYKIKVKLIVIYDFKVAENDHNFISTIQLLSVCLYVVRINLKLWDLVDDVEVATCM